MGSRYIAIKRLAESFGLGIVGIDTEKREVAVEYISFDKNGMVKQATLPSRIKLQRASESDDITFNYAGNTYKIKEFRKVGKGA